MDRFPIEYTGTNQKRHITNDDASRMGVFQPRRLSLRDVTEFMEPCQDEKVELSSSDQGKKRYMVYRTNSPEGDFHISIMPSIGNNIDFHLTWQAKPPHDASARFKTRIYISFKGGEGNIVYYAIPDFSTTYTTNLDEFVESVILALQETERKQSHRFAEKEKEREEKIKESQRKVIQYTRTKKIRNPVVIKDDDVEGEVLSNIFDGGSRLNSLPQENIIRDAVSSLLTCMTRMFRMYLESLS